MKIAFLSHLDLNLYLFRLPIMEELVRRGHKVYAICPKGELFNEFHKHQIEPIAYKMKRGSLNSIDIYATIKEIQSVVQRIDPDILHSFTHQPNIYGSFVRSRNYIQTVTGLGSFFVHSDLKSKMIRFAIEKAYRLRSKKAKRVIFQNSDDLEYFVTKNIIDRKKACLIKSSGIDTDIWKSEKKPSNTKPVVLMIARVIRDKGVEEFIKAASMLKDKAKFIYVGDIDRGNKNAFVPDWKNVEFLGFRRDIKGLIEQSDIVVLPSYREGVPRTLIEAAAVSKPIVTTDTVGCKEVVDDGVNGFLVPIKDAKRLAQKIEILIDNKELREKMGQESRKKAVNEFDIKIVTEKYLKLYSEFIDV